MVPIPKDVPSIGQIKRQTAEENLINHEEWFSWGKGGKRETMVVFLKIGLDAFSWSLYMFNKDKMVSVHNKFRHKVSNIK